MQDVIPDAPPPPFLRSVNIVLITYIIDGAIAFVASVLLARMLHPDGRGAYTLFVISATFAQVVLGLGAGAAATYHLNKGTLHLGEVMDAVQLLVAAALVVTTILVVAIAPWAGDPIGGVPLWLFIAGVPLLLLATLLRFVLQAMHRFAEQGIALLIQTTSLLALLALSAGHLTTTAAVTMWIASNAIAVGYALQRIGRRYFDPRAIVRPRWSVPLSLVRFGVQGESGTILQLLNYRLDAYVVGLFVGLAGVGFYSVAVSVTEAIWFVPNAVAVVLMPRLSAVAPDEARSMAPVASRNTIAVAASLAAIAGIAAPVIVPLVFGPRFEASVGALWWLLPGAVALAGSKVITSYIFSQGRPFVNTLITVVSLAVTLVADFTLIPAFGVNGAAAASSLAYVSHLGAALYAYRRISGQPALAALLPRTEDAHLYADAARGAWSKLSRRAAAAGLG